MNTAVRDGAITKNPCNIPGAGTDRAKERPVASPAQVASLIEAITPRCRAAILLNAGLRVFDIRDPHHPTEIAYYKPGAVRTAFRPSSGSWAPGADRTVDKVAAWVRWVQVGNDWELWFVSDGNGFQIVRFTNSFMAHHSSLFPGPGK